MPRRIEKAAPQDRYISRAFGIGLRTVRWGADITQVELAQRSIVSQITICNIENHGKGASLPVAYALASALDRTVDELIEIGKERIPPCRK